MITKSCIKKTLSRKCTTTKVNVNSVRKCCNLNDNLVAVSFQEQTKELSLQFWGNTLRGKTLQYFDMPEQDYDLNDFEEFATTCIDGFDGSILSDATVINKAGRFYRKVYHCFREYKQAKFQRFLTSSQQRLAQQLTERLLQATETPCLF